MRSLLLPLLLVAPAALAAPSVDIVVNEPTQFDRPLDQCITEHCKGALTLIEGAQQTLDVAIYGLRNQTALYDAIVAAKARGVRVRLVVDKDLEDQNYYTSTPKLEALLGDMARDDHDTDRRTAATKKPYDPSKARCESPDGFDGPAQCLGYDLGDRCLVAVHASREALNFQGDIMHNKYIVADGTRVWMGSTNLSDSGTGGYNANIVAVIDHPQVGAWYTAEFEQMWEGKRYHSEKTSTGTRKALRLDEDLSLELFFSPQDDPMERAVRPLLQNARQSIEVGVFFLTHKGIAGDLIEAHRRGVKVRVMIDATAATNGYTKHELLRAAGIPVKVENWGGKLHMKSASIDGQHLIVGSMNWTSAGTGSNDENTLVLHSRRLTREFDQVFQRIWTSIPDRWLEGRPDAESQDTPVACADGVDNDYDHLKDSEDPGCSDKPPPLPPLPPYQVVPKAEGNGLIKGVVLEDGRKMFYGPTSRFYERTVVDVRSGGQWFCSEGAAWDAGFKRSRE